MENLLVLGALGFAAYRGTQLVVWDSILDGWRKRVELWRIAKLHSRSRKFFWDLITCIYCTGFHISWLTVAAYHTATTWSGTNVLTFGLESFVVAGVQALLNRWDDSQPGHQPLDEGEGA